MRRFAPIISLVAVLSLGVAASAQQQNSGAGTFTIASTNGAVTGAAPFAGSYPVAETLTFTVSGNPGMPFVVGEAAGISVGATVFPGGQIDIGPNPQVVIDGYFGPFSPILANTGPSGALSFSAVVAPSTPLGLFSAFQGLVVDFSQAPFFRVFTAATEVSFVVATGMNSAPVANAGTSFFAANARCVTLDGTASVDPDGSPLTYSWTQVGGPSVLGDPFVTFDPNSATPSFRAPLTAANLVFELVVNDGTLSSAPSTVNVPVRVTPTTVSFATDIMPLVNNGSCTGCHGGSGGLFLDGSNGGVYANVTAPATTSANYPGMPPRVDLCNPATSPLILTQLDSGLVNSHNGGSSLIVGGANYNLFLNWIAEGAQNN